MVFGSTKYQIGWWEEFDHPLQLIISRRGMRVQRRMLRNLNQHPSGLKLSLNLERLVRQSAAHLQVLGPRNLESLQSNVRKLKHLLSLQAERSCHLAYHFAALVLLQIALYGFCHRVNGSQLRAASKLCESLLQLQNHFLITIELQHLVF